MPNLVEISETVSEIWRFFIFQDGGRRPHPSRITVCAAAGACTLHRDIMADTLYSRIAAAPWPDLRA